MKWLDMAVQALPKLIELGKAIRKAVIKRRIGRERDLQEELNQAEIARRKRKP